MVSTEVQPEPPDAETLSFGPAARTGRHRRSLIVGTLVTAVVLAAVGAWRVWPEPLPDFTAEDLTGAYTGMVRSDGTNQVSALSRDRLTEPPVRVVPGTCAPLFEETLSNQFPATARDGVSTYWLQVGSATVSLVTFRYADDAAAAAQFSEISDALGSCTGATLTVDRRADVSVVRQAVPPLAKVDNYLSFLVSSPPATTRFTTDVVQLSNTVTWQYRYDYETRANYSPLGAQQLMGALVSQLQDVQNAHRGG